MSIEETEAALDMVRDAVDALRKKLTLAMRHADGDVHDHIDDLRRAVDDLVSDHLGQAGEVIEEQKAAAERRHVAQETRAYHARLL